MRARLKGWVKGGGKGKAVEVTVGRDVRRCLGGGWESVSGGIGEVRLITRSLTVPFP